MTTLGQYTGETIKQGGKTFNILAPVRRAWPKDTYWAEVTNNRARRADRKFLGLRLVTIGGGES